MDQDQFYDLVAARADRLRERVPALVEATLTTLAERISGGQAHDLAEQLPEPLRPALATALEPAQPLSVEEFADRVSMRAGVDAEEARVGASAVLVTVRGTVTPQIWNDVLAQLPQEYAGLIDAIG
jgi:uncharacterized protein (DUF2267 family)